LPEKVCARRRDLQPGRRTYPAVGRGTSRARRTAGPVRWRVPRRVRCNLWFV